MTRREAAKRLLAAGFASLLPSARAASPAAKPRLGINLAGPAYYNTELPFVDLMRMARGWEIKPLDPAGKQSIDVAPYLDDDGWIRRLPDGTWAETPLAVLGRIPLGKWNALYDGRGRVEVWGSVRDIRQAPGQVTFHVAPHEQVALWLRIWRTDPADPVRRIRVLMPGHENSYATQPWNPSLLQRWTGMAAIRFMDFMATNNSKVSRWSDRARPQSATFSDKGVAAELLIDLANRLKANAWFCMPHLADDDFVRRFATLARDRLDPTLRVYLEYSNEAWNALFQQHHYVYRAGRSLGLARDDFEAGLRYTTRRALQIFKIWEDVFGDRSRLVRVLASQAVNPWTAQTMLSVPGASTGADAIAIANYIGIAPTPKGSPSEAVVVRWSIEELFDELDKVLAGYERVVRSNAALAQKHGLRLLAYEGGQHLAGYQGAENNERLTGLFTAANRHPRMGELYRRIYRMWESSGGDLMCHFSSVNPSSKWGSWGLLEHHDDDPASAPKYVESLRWARGHGQDVAVPG